MSSADKTDDYSKSIEGMVVRRKLKLITGDEKYPFR